MIKTLPPEHVAQNKLLVYFFSLIMKGGDVMELIIYTLSALWLAGILRGLIDILNK